MRSISRLGFGFALAAGLGLWSGPGAAAEGYLVQLASVKSEARAREEWARLQGSHPDLLGDLALTVQRANLGARGVYYRIQTGPFPNEATAQDMCWQLRAAKLDCLIVTR